jgi:uncharacterized RDD family membrane protein YckC
MPNRTLVAAPFHVESHLLGRPLASPTRRFLAFLIDALLLIIPTLIVVVPAAALSLYVGDRSGFYAVRNIDRYEGTDAASIEEAQRLAKLLVRVEATGVPAAMTAAVEENDLDEAAEILRGQNIQFAMGFEEERAGPLPPKTIRLPIDRLIPGAVRAAVMLIVPALYFAGFARSKRKATIGKRLLGIYVERLDGERLSWMEGLERFVGLVHIPATMFVSLLDLWRDKNRRLPHDRTVHTAVLRGRP